MKRKLCKRILDVGLATVGLVLSAPIFAAVALLIWLDEPGGVLFAQTRLGLNGKPFRLLKFRKFSAHCGDAGPGVTVAGDARMTRIGAVIERTKLDELPQLWNILKGDMSFVGPRPESLRFAHLYQGEYLHLLQFLPGLFGPCQIAFRNESGLYPENEDPEVFYRRVLFPQKAKIDLDYFPRSTWLMDVAWILRGLWVTLAGTADWSELLRSNGKTVAADAAIVWLSWVVATVLHSSSISTASDYPAFVFGLWTMPPIVIAGLALSGFYRIYGDVYFAFVDAVRLVNSVTVSLGLAFLAILAFASSNATLYLLPIAWLVLLSGLAMPRAWSRLKREKSLEGGKVSAPPIIIYGANANGVALANWLAQGEKRQVLAFLDDEPGTRGKQLMGRPILNRPRDALTLRPEEKTVEIWVAHRLHQEQKTRITHFCHSHQLKLVMLSEVYNLPSPSMRAGTPIVMRK